MRRQIKLDELDAVLDRADSVITSDYAAAMGILGEVSVALSPPSSMTDPFSEEYSDWVMSTYKRITDVQKYKPLEHEADHNVQNDIPFNNYFPYNTKDLHFIGRYLTGVGLILSELGLPPGSRIVEYGIGWGHVAAALARAGHNVTCVDIEAKFLYLAQRQARAHGCEVAIHHGEFGNRPFPDNESRADAVVFFEAFHHSFEHRSVLRRLRQNVLRPGGVLILAAEPIDPAFPIPWGIRPDGHALWAVRRFKWMELGFQEDYLLKTLLREGFLISRTRIEVLGSFGLLYRARLHTGDVIPGETILPGVEAVSWAPQAQGDYRLWAQVDSRMTLDNDPRWDSVTVANHLPVPLDAALDAGGAGPVVRRRFSPGEVTPISLLLPRADRELRVWSETACPAALGSGDDRRLLGVAVEKLTYHGG